jgi:hypothetical protein
MLIFFTIFDLKNQISSVQKFWSVLAWWSLALCITFRFMKISKVLWSKRSIYFFAMPTYMRISWLFFSLNIELLLYKNSDYWLLFLKHIQTWNFNLPLINLMVQKILYTFFCHAGIHENIMTIFHFKNRTWGK